MPRLPQEIRPSPAELVSNQHIHPVPSYIQPVTILKTPGSLPSCTAHPNTMPRCREGQQGPLGATAVVHQGKLT